MSDEPPPVSSTPSRGDSGHVSQLNNMKRKRVSMACRSCRIRKSRCDGGQPCSTCHDMELPCRYDQPTSQPVAVASIAAGTGSVNLQPENTVLEQRLLALEQKIQSLEQDRRSDRPSRRSGSPGASISSTTPSQADQHTTTTWGLIGSPDQDDVVDGMGSVALKDGADEDEYFGPSSNVAFLRLIVRGVDHAATPGDYLPQPPMDVPSACFEADGANALLTKPAAENPNKVQQPRPMEPFALPSPSEAEELLRVYFTTVNLMVPFIHEDSFLEMYRKARSDGARTMRKSWLGVLNMLLAVGTNVLTPTSPPLERTSRADMYFERAVELVKPQMLGRLSVELVQLFLLMEMYLEGTAYSSLVWTFHSLAVKGVYQLGLYCRGSKALSPLDAEIQRRLWCVCSMNDRWLSVTYGRPPLIPSSHVRPETSSHIAFSNVPNSTTTLSLAYFDANMSITHIIGDVVDQLYDQNFNHSTTRPVSDTLEQISRLCWKLAQWQDNLPACLRIITSTDTIDSVPPCLETTRFRVLLSLRYLGTRILVLRPTITQFLDLSVTSASDESRSKWLWNSGTVLLTDLVRTCTDVLHTSKNILAASRKDQNILGAWWFSCYYTFNASLAILGVLLIKRNSGPTKLSAFTIAELRALLDSAMEILQGLDKGNKTVMRCRDSLSRLVNAFDLNAPAAGTAAPLLPLSPTSTWAWQLIDPGMFGPEASSTFVPRMFDTARPFPFTNGFEMDHGGDIPHQEATN